jgi:uncharacterized protein (TIGR03435 family)
MRRNPLRIFLTLPLLAISLFAQTPAVPAFEVASIKAAAPPNAKDAASGRIHVGMNIDAARVDLGFMSLADLISVAYRVKPHQVSGPDWMVTQRFDILAKIPEGATKEQVPEMLQALLAERFGLAAHRENKEHPVYALVVVKGGPKIKEATSETTPPPADAPKEGVAIGTPDGEVRVKQTGSGVVINGGKNGPLKMSMGPNGMHWEAERMSMSGLSDMLTRFVDRPVVDMTDLSGNYQFALDVSMDDLRSLARKAGMGGQMPPPGAGGPAAPGAGPANPAPASAASDPSGGSIFVAIRELGLRLEPRKLPVETIVVDHLEKTPTEN